jgi:hypothetical protein
VTSQVTLALLPASCDSMVYLQVPRDLLGNLGNAA